MLDVSDLRFVTLNLDERHAALLKPGQAANIVLRFYPDAEILGVVDVVLPPSGLVMPFGSPPSMIATQEFVVPKSIPITLPISFPP